jgi:hypothetical protein
MALFSDDRYQWRETYFVLFREADRPSAEAVKQALRDGRSEISELKADPQGKFESVTVKSPEDFSGMDITYVTGEEVTEQIDELLRELVKQTLNDDDRTKLNTLGECNARFDIFHFEEVQADTDDDEFLDPGALLLVLERLARLCRGVGIDPQSGSLIG